MGFLDRLWKIYFVQNEVPTTHYGGVGTAIHRKKFPLVTVIKLCCDGCNYRQILDL